VIVAEGKAATGGDEGMKRPPLDVSNGGLGVCKSGGTPLPL
jgi:hypothetical protein